MSECRVDGCWGECEQHNVAPKFDNVASELDPLADNIFKGGPSTKALTYAKLEKAYQSATSGDIEPNIILVNPKTYSAIKSEFQPQQKYTYNIPSIGLHSLKYNNAAIIPSSNAPSGTLTFITHNGTAKQVSIDDFEE